MLEILIYDFIGHDPWTDKGVRPQAIHDALEAASGDVLVRINSPGGMLDDGLTIYNLLRGYTKGKVITLIDGLAASAASVIFLAGRERKASENSFFMIHNPTTIAVGDANEMRKTADYLDMNRDTLVNIYKGVTDYSEEELIDMLDKETWFEGPDAVEAGFATEVVNEGMKVAACAGLDRMKFKNIPAALKALSAAAAKNNIKATRREADAPRPGAATADKKRRVEDVLREAGLSRSEAKKEASRILSLREAGADDHRLSDEKVTEITIQAIKESIYEIF